MKRATLITCMLLAVASLLWATSPHFNSASATISGDQLIVSWFEAGLGNNQNISYSASADGSAT